MTSYEMNETLATVAEPTAAPTDAGSGRWMRSCPMCNLLLNKKQPWIAVQCECGWQWRN